MPTTYPYAPDIVRATDEFTRPADTTAYTIGDAVGGAASDTVFPFTNAAKNTGGSSRLKSVKIAKSGTTITLATFRLALFRTAPTAVADNAAFPIAYADRNAIIGYVDMDIMASNGGGGGFTFKTVDIPLKFTTGKTLYGVLIALGAYVPANAETFAIELAIERY
jgi:hypothetical protein